jgi:FtsH-binding integral membrane protein
MMASASLMLSIAQLIATDAIRGRVMSVYNLALRAEFPLGGLILARLVPALGVSTAFGGAGLMLLAVSLYFLLIKRDATLRTAHDAYEQVMRLSCPRVAPTR